MDKRRLGDVVDLFTNVQMTEESDEKQRHNGEGSLFRQKRLVRAFSVTQYTEQEKTPLARVVRGVAVFMGLLS